MSHLREHRMSRLRHELRRVVSRVVHEYDRAKAGHVPSATAHQAADLDDYQAIIEVEAFYLAQNKPKACCSKCAAKDAAKADAEAAGMDVVFIPRSEVLT